MSNLIKVGVTHGDINGVGYEVILKALAEESVTELFTPVIFGYKDLIDKAKTLLELNDLKINVIDSPQDIKEGKINLIQLAKEVPEHNPGKIDKKSGEAAVAALNMAVESIKNKDIDVLVTAPISKEAVNSEEFNFPGHTEFLQEVSGQEGAEALMILCNENVRVALLTVHIPISKVAGEITESNILRKAKILNESLKKDFGYIRPRIAVLSLNPHGGDGGVLGSEEQEIIKPAIEALREDGILAFGPYPADGFFGHGSYKNFDGILAMYHDQGLAPFKTLASNGGVNFTAGLPFVRTSPDHGTAYDIAWTGKAEGDSMREAMFTAIDIFRRRKSYEEAQSNPLKKYMPEKSDRGERNNPTKKQIEEIELND